MSETWWQDPPKNSTAGGFLKWKRSEDILETVSTGNQIQFCGWYTQNEGNLFQDKNECYYYHSFIKFAIPQDIGDIESVGLTVRVANVGYKYIITEPEVGYWISVLTLVDDLGSEWFPYQILSEADMYQGTGGPWYGYWESMGNWRKFWDIYMDYYSDGQHWLPMFDVTDKFVYAKNNNLPYFSVRLIPNYNAPHNWNYNMYLYDRELWVSFFGGAIGDDYNTDDMPEGFPVSGMSKMVTPWLKIVHDGGSQWEPGESEPEEINCIASDYQSQSALVGTTTGSLWRTTNYGQNWSKIFETEKIVTSGEL